MWIKTAIRLAERGHEVQAWLELPDQDHPDLARLDAAGVKRHHLSELTLAPLDKIRNRLRPRGRKMDPRREAMERLPAYQPDLCLLSWAMNLDGGEWADFCLKRQIPYIILPNLATEMYWPDDHVASFLRPLYQGATSIFFVSRGNLELTQEQLSTDLPRGQVIRNSFKVNYETIQPWPPVENPLSWACPARLDIANKGQDLLIRVLAQPRWKERPLTVHLYGSGHNEQGLKDMAARHGVTNLIFEGHVEDITAVWRRHQAMILPSRMEGLPISVVEAQLSGRLCIVTPVPGSAELLLDNETGFIGRSIDAAGLDDAMERAWTRRADWQAMGDAAARHIRTLVPPDPVDTLADEMERLLTADKKPQSPVA